MRRRRRALRDELWDAWLGASRRADIELTPNLPEVLAALDDAGMRIGIVCDVGLTPSLVLLEFLERHGVLRHFDHWSFSDEVGVFKPDAAIFRHALDGLGVDDPARALHIGDLRRTDIAGAQADGHDRGALPAACSTIRRPTRRSRATTSSTTCATYWRSCAYASTASIEMRAERRSSGLRDELQAAGLLEAARDVASS